MKTGGSQSFSFHESSELALIVLGASADEKVLVFPPALHFEDGVIEPEKELLGTFGCAFVEALREDFHAGWS